MDNSYINKNINSNSFEDNYSNQSNYHIYKNYSINEYDFPKNFIPIIKPKDVIFGNEENIIPFSLDFSFNENNEYIRNNNCNYKYKKELKCQLGLKKKYNPILEKLIKKRQLSNNCI